MKMYLKIGSVILVLMSTATFAGCQKKEVKDVKVVKTERVVAPEALSLQSLDKRVSDLERSRAAARKAFRQNQQVVKGF